MVANISKGQGPTVSQAPVCFVCNTKAPSHILQPGAAHVFGAAAPLVTTNNQRSNASVVVCINCLNLLRNCLLTFAQVQMENGAGQVPPPPPSGPQLKYHPKEDNNGND